MTLRIEAPHAGSRAQVSVASRWLPWVAAVFASGLRLATGSFPVDDAYITFRYARNLVTGFGLVYNQGETVLGTSSPMFTLLLAAPAAVFGVEHIPLYAFLMSAAADGVAVWLMSCLALMLGIPSLWAGLAVFLQALAPLSVRYAGSGLEASLVTALLLGAVYAHVERRDGVAAHLAGASALLRPDGLAVGAVIVASLALEKRRVPWRTVAILAAWIAPVALVISAIYGSPVPHTVAAKSSPIYQVGPLTNGLQFLYHFGGLFIGAAQGLAARGLVIRPEAGLTLVYGLFAALQFPLWVKGAGHAWRTDGRWFAAIAYPVLFASVYTAVGLRGSLMAEWYLVPLLPLWILFFTDGLRQALASLRPRLRRFASLTLGCAMLACMVGGLNLGRDASRPFLTPAAVWDEREKLYAQVAAFLVPRVGTGDVVAASEIGALGFGCNCRILDTVGLASPDSLNYYPISADLPGFNAVPPGLIHDQRPEYLVSLEIFVRPTLSLDGWFRENYRPILRLETQAFGSDGLFVYQRLP
ncbi:MAG: hypothetical protein AB1449_14030 [Chloroflexota bacterium]